ncbi:MAG TPA: FAD/NAD(P)-binding protein [Micromonospora sp.]
MEIGVVGGGASAVCFIDALTRTDLRDGGLTVYEPSPYLWRGRPFQPDLESVRVNAPPIEMSVRADEPDHFERWLGAQPKVVDPDPFNGALFPTRAQYGEYLVESAEAAIAELRRRGWRVEIVRSPVTAVRPARDRLALRTAHGRCHVVDYGVLCIGGGRPQDAYRLAGTRGFVADPYPLRLTLAGIDPAAPVAVIGCGLTAVDVVLGLIWQGHTGPIRMVSRSGVLPGVRQRPITYELRHFTPDVLRRWAATRDRVSLAELVSLMRRELAEAGPAAEAEVRRELAAVATEPPLERLRRHLSEVNSSAIGMRILQRAVPDTGPDVWPLLSHQEQEHILRHHYRTLMSLCCPMPPESAATLVTLMESGQLTVHSGLTSVTPRPRGGFDVTVGDTTFAATYVVNAASAEAHRIPPMAQSLVRCLESEGIAARHPRGGLRLERATSRLVPPHGRAHFQLFGIGDIAAGELFFTFGVPSLVDRAVDVATAIADVELRGATRRLVAAGVA